MAKKPTKQNKKPDRIKLTTPAGEAQYPWLTKPNTKFDEEGKFSCDLILNKKDKGVQEFIDTVEEFAGGGKAPFKDMGDGTVKFKAKTGVAYPPALFDAKGNALPNTVKIGSGSTVKLAVSLGEYEGFGGGVTAYLRAVQVLKLVEYGGNADAFGFDADEDGYEFSKEAPTEEAEGDPDFATDDDIPF